MSKTKKIIASIVAVFLLCGTFFLGFFIGKGSLDKDLQAINYIVSSYKKYYYEQSDDIVSLIEDALLDQYSEYYTKEEYKTVLSTSQGEREGIGFSYNKTTNEIIQVLGNSPAKKAGVKVGGVVLGAGLSLSEITYVTEANTLDAILSEIPANVDFIFKVSYGTEVVDYTLRKEKYLQTFVSYYDDKGEYGFSDSSGEVNFERIGDNEDFPLDDVENTAVIKYSGFSGLGKGLNGSSGQFKKALEVFKERGKTKLILDIRDNGGGYMSILSSVASHLICVENGSKKLISYAVYNDGSKGSFYSDSVDYNDYGFENIIILANENSASASEALIGAVLDYDEKDIVNVILESSYLGEELVYKTYGKGIMQTTYKRYTGEAIKLTTAKIYWPVSNKSIHGVGVTKDTSEKVLCESSSGAFYDALKLLK